MTAYEVEVSWATGQIDLTRHASYAVALAYARNLRDPQHVGSARDHGVRELSAEYDAAAFARGILARVDVTRAGCVASSAVVQHLPECMEDLT